MSRGVPDQSCRPSKQEVHLQQFSSRAHGRHVKYGVIRCTYSLMYLSGAPGPRRAITRAISSHGFTPRSVPRTIFKVVVGRVASAQVLPIALRKKALRVATSASTSRPRQSRSARLAYRIVRMCSRTDSSKGQSRTKFVICSSLTW